MNYLLGRKRSLHLTKDTKINSNQIKMLNPNRLKKSLKGVALYFIGEK